MNKRNLKWLTLLGLPVMVLSFQNCSDFALQNGIVEQQSLLGSQSVLDNQELPGLTDTSDSSSLVRWYKQGQPSFVDKAYAGADKLSFIVAFDRAMTGRVFAANSGSDNVEETNITVAGGKIRVNRISSAGNVAYAEVGLPSIGSKVVVAVSSSSDPKVFSLLVNGVLQTITVNKTGSPQEFSYVTKNFVVGSTGGKVYEYVVYNDKLTSAQLNTMSRYVGEANAIAQVIFDPSVLTDPNDVPGGAVSNAQFLLAKAVIDSNCLGCHGSGSSYGDFSNMTAAKMINKGLVKAGQPLQSPLYYRLNGSQGSGTKNMPQGGSLSSTQVKVIYDWIASIN